jgi:hypothetical protein
MSGAVVSLAGGCAVVWAKIRSDPRDHMTVPNSAFDFIGTPCGLDNVNTLSS